MSVLAGLLATTPASKVQAQDAIPLREVRVTAPAGNSASATGAGTLSQDAPIGPYNQPEWTTLRSFSTSRVYVRPPGTIEFVQYWTPEFKDGESEHSFRSEIEIGLPYRFQLDLYQNWGIDEEGESSYGGTSVELRYALADWGKIPLNPTLYGEWNFNHDAPDVWEVKLLLGETLAPRWSWAGNIVFEQETGGESENEIAVSTALTYAAIDRTLNIGIEALAERKTEAGARNDPEYEVLVGPTVNVRPTRDSFITVAPLFGLTEDSPDVEVFVVAGYQFKFGGPRGAAESEEGPRAPASMFGR